MLSIAIRDGHDGARRLRCALLHSGEQAAFTPQVVLAQLSAGFVARAAHELRVDVVTVDDERR